MMDFIGCDHCGPSIRAYFYFEMPQGELSYCGSCGTRYEAGIIKQGGWIVDDQRHLITA